MSFLVSVSVQNVIPRKIFLYLLHLFRWILVRNCEAHVSKLWTHDCRYINLQPGNVTFLGFLLTSISDQMTILACLCQSTMRLVVEVKFVECSSSIKNQNKTQICRIQHSMVFKNVKSNRSSFYERTFLPWTLWCLSSPSEWLTLF